MTLQISHQRPLSLLTEWSLIEFQYHNSRCPFSRQDLPVLLPKELASCSPPNFKSACSVDTDLFPTFNCKHSGCPSTDHPYPNNIDLVKLNLLHIHGKAPPLNITGSTPPFPPKLIIQPKSLLYDYSLLPGFTVSPQKDPFLSLSS